MKTAIRISTELRCNHNHYTADNSSILRKYEKKNITKRRSIMIFDTYYCTNKLGNSDYALD